MLSQKFQLTNQITLKDKLGDSRFLTVIGYDTPLFEVTFKSKTYYISFEEDACGNTIYNEDSVDERLKLQKHTPS
tara:strand:+ start:1345 stop:1569 length:225 start_codon:yes stop_codon:yes gene_type:complete